MLYAWGKYTKPNKRKNNIFRGEVVEERMGLFKKSLYPGGGMILGSKFWYLFHRVKFGLFYRITLNVYNWSSDSSVLVD